MGDRELKDLQQQIRAMRRLFVANEHRRALQRLRERPPAVRVVARSLNAAALWVRDYPVQLAAASVVAMVGIYSLATPSSLSDDEPQRSPIIALPETGQSYPVGTATVTLSTVASETDGRSDAEPAEPDEDPDGERATKPDGGSAADPGSSLAGPSLDQQEQATADSAGEPAAASGASSGAPDPAPAPEPELSDIGDSDDPPASEPKPADPSDPEPPDDDEPDADASCLGVNALGLTVDLCLPPLLGS